MTERQPLNILLVEDSPSDVEITREALGGTAIPHRLAVLTHGDEVMPYLRRTGKAVDAETPHLVLLDLNLPGMNGRELLKQIKADPELRLIPVVVLTTSSQDGDIRDAYGSHANAYLIKPIDWASFEKVALDLATFWSDVLQLAAGRPHPGSAPEHPDQVRSADP